WDLLDSADAVVTFNGDRADIPWMNEEFAYLDLPRPMPYRSIDLYKMNRKRFARPYKSLRYIAREVGTAGKLDTSGKDLWELCELGDPVAWDEMRAYNAQEVRTTEELWLKQL